MKKLIVMVLVLVSSSCLAETYEVKARYQTFGNSSFMKAGSYNNPYVVSTSNGSEVGTIKPKYATFGDSSFMKPGTTSNPYVFETN